MGSRSKGGKMGVDHEERTGGGTAGGARGGMNHIDPAV